MSNPFDYVNDILYTKNYLLVDEEEYVPFLTNRSLSYHVDCIMFANVMNGLHSLDNKMQHDYLFNTIRSKKRTFKKWIKRETKEDLDLIKRIYNYSTPKALDILKLLSENDLDILRNKYNKGGI